MSGFEVAGVVLGAIPLLISALEHYKRGRSTAAALIKWRGQLDILIFRLQGQRFAFYFHILELLRAAGVEEVSFHDVTEEECLLILQDAKKGVQVQDYLGVHHYAFLDILRRYETCLKAIARKLKHIKRLPDAAKDDLRALLAANSPCQGKFEFRQRISFSIEKGVLNDLIEELKEDRLSLKIIIKGMKTQREYLESQPSHDAQRLANIFTRIQGHAKSLFAAMCRSCTCEPQNRHKVLLQLDNRIPVSNEKRRVKDNHMTQITFHLVLNIDGRMQEALISTDPFNTTQTAVPLQRQQLAVCVRPGLKTPKVVAFADQTNNTHITNKVTAICHCASESRLAGHVLRLSLADDSLEILDEESESKRDLVSSKSLDDLLQHSAANDDDRMTPKQQTLLALDVACSIVQLRQTCWFGNPFSSKVVKFLLQKQGHDATAIYTPFIEQVADPDQEDPLGPDPKTALLELAILLLEIWHHMTLETWSVKSGIENVETLEARQRAAIRWLEMTSERLPLHHLTAIEQCLAFCSGRLRFWHDQEFLKLYCENIIKPLSQLPPQRTTPSTHHPLNAHPSPTYFKFK